MKRLISNVKVQARSLYSTEDPLTNAKNKVLTVFIALAFVSMIGLGFSIATDAHVTFAWGY